MKVNIYLILSIVAMVCIIISIKINNIFTLTIDIIALILNIGFYLYKRLRQVGKMSKCKIIKANSYVELEEKINDFIKDKNVTNINMPIRAWDGHYKYYLDDYFACITYKD